ncbi:hypothetical protein PI125_g472 [Phytophthora idaei]|nr:hypothetical protein PI125_g472 [Phytophthora idaei]KAG3165924.1 hypothetical protein PI126_g4397 [Phytophthora idaei]
MEVGAIVAIDEVLQHTRETVVPVLGALVVRVTVRSTTATYTTGDEAKAYLASGGVPWKLSSKMVEDNRGPTRWAAPSFSDVRRAGSTRGRPPAESDAVCRHS